MAVIMDGVIRGATLKTDPKLGKPLLEIKIDCGFADEHTMYALVDLWRQKSAVEVILQPIVEQKELPLAVIRPEPTEEPSTPGEAAAAAAEGGDDNAEGAADEAEPADEFDLAKVG